MCFSPKFYFGEKHIVGFYKLKHFKNTFDSVTAENSQIGPILEVSSLTHLHCKSNKFLNFCIFLHLNVNFFIV